MESCAAAKEKEKEEVEAVEKCDQTWKHVSYMLNEKARCITMRIKASSSILGLSLAMSAPGWLLPQTFHRLAPCHSDAIGT